MKRYYFADLVDIPENKFLIKEIKGISMGGICIDGDYHVIMNYCPHEGAEICKGSVGGTSLACEVGQNLTYDLDGRVLSCPWHGWEFELISGKGLFPSKKELKVKKFRCESEDGSLFVII